MKKVISIFALFLIMVTVVGCSAESSGSKSEKVNLELAHIFPEKHPGGVFLDKFAKEVKEKTDGNVSIKIHHNAVLGSESDEIQQLQSGNLDMALFYGTSNFQTFDPVFGVEELPFIFTGPEHAHRAFDGKFGDKMAEMLKENNFTVLSYWENGFRHFTNNSRAIKTPEDLKGIKFRSAEIPLRLKMFELLNAKAIPIGFNELFTALQQGTVDGQENPLSTINSSKFYEVQDYLSLSGHIYNSAPLIASNQAMEKLTEEHRKVIFDVAKRLKKEQREELANRNEKLVEKLKEKGMKVNEVNRKAFQEAVKPLWDSFTDKNGEELVKLILDAK